MGLLDSLLGGGGQMNIGDFVNRFERGAPWDGFSDEEAQSHYQNIAAKLPPEEYEAAARDAFARFSPQEREQFGRQLLGTMRRQDYNIPDLNQDGIDDRLQDPDMLAHLTTEVHRHDSGLLASLLGGRAGGGMLGSPLARAALGGIAAMAIRRLANNRF